MTTGVPGYQSYFGGEQVTGEAVALESPVASVVARAGARVLDTLAAIAAALPLVLLLAWLGMDGAISTPVMRIGIILTLLIAVLVMPVGFEMWTRGRTLGKMALSLRTVREDGGPISFRQSLGRALIGWVEIYLLAGGPATVSAVITPRVQRLGDLAMGTYVISERHSVSLPPPPQTPPGLAAWVTTADLATLPTGLALAIRQFLGRAESMTPTARAAVGQQLVAAALTHVSPQPPAGFHPEFILMAVLADRRRRDQARLARDDATRARVLGRNPSVPG